MELRAAGFETKVIHAGEPTPRIGGAVVLPVFQSSTYKYSGEASYHDVRYIRLNNTPNHQALGEKIAALENGESALVTASGMAAISTTLLTILRSGDHLLAHKHLYGGTHSLLTHDFDSLGLSYTFVDCNGPETLKSHLRPNTKAIYVESITNPLMEVPDLDAVVRFARENGLLSLIDNTFASPVNYRPIERGFDIVLHSCTKYLNGHNDLVSGAVVSTAERVEQIRHKLNHLGGTLDPHACFLLHRGLKTLALRVHRQNDSALQIARFLEQQPAVARVNYPGLESHPQHGRAGEWFDGFGGMLSFELCGGTASGTASGTEAAEQFLDRVTIALNAVSLGGVESLITLPAKTSHAGMTAEERHRLGIADGLIRLSVGIEDTGDLMADFKNALDSQIARPKSPVHSK